MPVIDIKRVAGDVVFEPAELTIAARDIVFWRNWDPIKAHWITKLGERQDLWFTAELPPFVEGQPPETTSALVGPASGTIVYECRLTGKRAKSPSLPHKRAIGGGESEAEAM
jgi:plastocyanin